MIRFSISGFLILFFCFSTVLSSCLSSSHRETGELGENFLRIDLSKVEKRKYMNASEVISDIEYVALETSSDCLIGETFTMSVSENYILTFNVFNDNNFLLFSRKGKFIRKIGQKGSGPSDYIGGGVYSVKIDEENEMVYLMNYLEMVVYRITGEFYKKMNIYELTKKVGGSFYATRHWKDGLFCSGINITGKAQHRFIIFNLEGEILKLFPNHILYNSEKTGYPSFSGYNMTCYNEQMSYLPGLSDTLFRITEQFDMVPAIVFDFPGKKITDFEKYQLPYEEVKRIHSIHEIENYVWFSATEIDNCIYDRTNKRLISFERDPVFRRTIESTMMDGSTQSRTFFLSGLRNDLDGGLPFNPVLSPHVQNNRQLVCFYNSWVLKENLTDEYFAGYKVENVENREAHNRLKSLLAGLDWEDNPVLMIATFK